MKLPIHSLVTIGMPFAWRWISRFSLLTLLKAPFRLKVMSVTTLDYNYAWLTLFTSTRSACLVLRLGLPLNYVSRRSLCVLA
jgi:hypothetical protein